MADPSDEPDYGKQVWLWWEQLSYENAHENVDEDRLMAHLNHQWTKLPKVYKNAAVPILTELYDTLRQQEKVRIALASSQAPALEQWKNFTVHDVSSFVDCYWSASDRIPRLKQRLEMMHEIAGQLAKLTKLKGTFETCMSKEGKMMLKSAMKMLESEGSMVKEEIEHLEEFLPQYVEHEKTIRTWKRKQGFPDGTGWVGSWYLGHGSFGEVSLWVRQDHNGNIVNRAVVKQAAIDPSMQIDEAAWILDEGVYVPTEIYAPQSMSQRVGSESILQVRGWREMRGQNYFRVLLDYCPFGDLWDLRTKNYDPDPYGGAEFLPKLPEPFIWYVFECLATAGVLMEKGHIGRGLGTWRQIFHSDIKLGNIMLGPSNPRKYPHYPSPVLADFGFAQLWDKTPPAPSSRGGTPSCESPENAGCCYRKNGTHTRESGRRFEPLNRKTDVWSVGNIIWGLMAIHEGHDSMNFRGQGNEQPRHAPIGDLEGYYSESLLALVADCMEYFPEDRIDFSQCLRRILELTGSHPDPRYDHVYGLRTASKDSDAWDFPGVKLMLGAEKFPMYTKLAHAPDTYPSFKFNEEIPAPPHPERKLEEDGRYKGPVSADTKGLSRAGSERRHAATSKSRREHMQWLHNRREAKELGEVSRYAKVGYYVPDSSDDDGSERSSDFLEDSYDDAPTKKAQHADPGPEKKNQLWKSKSRSAAAGANRSNNAEKDKRSISQVKDPGRKKSRDRVTEATKTRAARDPRRRPAPKQEGPPPVVRKQRMPGGFSDYKYI